MDMHQLEKAWTGGGWAKNYDNVIVTPPNKKCHQKNDLHFLTLCSKIKVFYIK